MKTPHIREIRRLALPLLLGSLLAACAMELPITRGEEMTQQGRWEEAVTFFQEAVKQDPRNLEARLGLTRALWVASQDFVRQGNDFERVDRPEDAKAAYRRALSYNGDNQLALAGLERIVRATDIQDRLKLARERMAKKEWGAARDRSSGRPATRSRERRRQGPQEGDRGHARRRGGPHPNSMPIPRRRRSSFSTPSR